MFTRLKYFGIAATVLATTVFASDWPCWRGPRGDGASDETNIPTRWSSGTNGTQNIAWKVAIPGWGHSSPVIWGDRLFVTTYVPDGEKRALLCLDRRSGKTLWDRTVLTSPPEKMNRLNSHASGTPATDGQRVWVAFLQTPNQ